jgi:hypothetical protein
MIHVLKTVPMILDRYRKDGGAVDQVTYIEKQNQGGEVIGERIGGINDSVRIMEKNPIP